MRSMTHLRAVMRLWIMFRMGFHEINGLLTAITVLKKKLRKHVKEMLKFESCKLFHISVDPSLTLEEEIETGQNPGRAQLYLATHRKNDGSYVNDAAKEICEKIDQTLS
ncbi:uncharacterized protein LOC107790319 isoform X2 [Nicotiana tabacum]|uniref:Uncharacterized protein LOC107790319 isoform X2 n=1 Tax=Nicotiana tabacum TaxID=4097 RepID=A0AC58SWW8_TOBAC